MPTPTYLFPAVDTHPTYLWHHPCFGTGVMSGTGGKGYKGSKDYPLTSARGAHFFTPICSMRVGPPNYPGRVPKSWGLFCAPISP